MLSKTDETLTAADGRTIGYAIHGQADGQPVLWCHGGPGNRLGITALGAEAERYLNICLDRPGYGLSSPQPGRTIADFAPDALAVLDAIGVERFIAVGGSTGGVYALALAAIAAQRVQAAVVYCGLSDMRIQHVRASVSANRIQEVWAAASRAEAIAICREVLGDDGSKMGAAMELGGLPPADLKLIQDPEFARRFMAAVPDCFTFGVQGYADDRLADGAGWGSFNPGDIRCPVVILHGESDTAVPVANAYQTAELVPGGELRLFADHGHFSIATEVLPVLSGLAHG
jgi:pimeloyl-ACP methyl ester carboxylesterase